MKTFRILFFVATGLLSLMMIFSAGMYFFKYDDVSAIFALLGFPQFIIYHLAVANLLAVAAIWTLLHPALVEWAYAGLAFDFLLAIGAHLNVGDGEHGGGIIAVVLLTLSYLFYRKTYGNLHLSAGN